MKKKALLITSIILALSVSAQTNSWVRKEIGNGLSVSFPTAPTYNLNELGSTYTAQNSNCVFMVMITHNVIAKDYDKFVLAESKWTENEKRTIAYAFLDNFVKGRIDSAGGKNVTSSNVKVGGFYGKKLEYSAVNILNGEVGKRFGIALALLKYNKVISFECWYLNNSTASESDKNLFFNSIKKQ
ncbi:MAG: hypothetical protein ACOX19_02995 [Fermentimonas sp.]